MTDHGRSARRGVACGCVPDGSRHLHGQRGQRTPPVMLGFRPCSLLLADASRPPTHERTVGEAALSKKEIGQHVKSCGPNNARRMTQRIRSAKRSKMADTCKRCHSWSAATKVIWHFGCPRPSCDACIPSRLSALQQSGLPSSGGGMRRCCKACPRNLKTLACSLSHTSCTTPCHPIILRMWDNSCHASRDPTIFPPRLLPKATAQTSTASSKSFRARDVGHPARCFAPAPVRRGRCLLGQS